MKYLQLSILLLLSSICLQAQQTKKALFIGNSYTAYNNLPQLVSEAALSVGDTLVFDAHTPGGQTLESHSTNTTALNKINSMGWDYVALQEQSQRPSFPIGQVEQEVFPYATSLCNSIRDNNPCTRPIFYMTWGRENGDSQNCANWPPVCTYEGMDSLLNLRYTIMANDNEAYLSPVGAVWHYIRDNYPDIDLYANDGSHPSQAGSYAAACSFYTVIFQKDPTAINFNFNLNEDEANLIKQAAHNVVFENMETYNVGTFDPIAAFETTSVDYETSFENNSQLADSYFWNFGDGMTSPEESPTHTYTQEGDYQVVLTASNDCGFNSKDTVEVKIEIISGLSKKDIEAIRLFPNPAGDILLLENLSTKAAKIEIVSFDGRVQQRMNKSESIDISALAKGLYFLRIHDVAGRMLQLGKFVIE